MMKVRTSQLLPGDIIVGYLSRHDRGGGVWLYADPGTKLKEMFVTVINVNTRNIITTSTGQYLYCYNLTYDCVNR